MNATTEPCASQVRGEAQPTEKTVFLRRKDLPGFETRIVHCAAGQCCHYATGYEFLTADGFRGELWHRRRKFVLRSGSVICAHPGEIIVGQRVLCPGSFSSVTIEPSVFRLYLSKLELPDWIGLPAFAQEASTLGDAIVGLTRAFVSGAQRTEVQSAIEAFFAGLKSIIDHNRGYLPHRAPDTAALGWVRDCLERGPRASNLAAFFDDGTLSRFQRLRAFKRRFGLPPYSYQLRVRLGLAQKSLREGRRPAQVAAEFGFVDQSHLTRHFKRFFGVTPAEYAQAIV